MIGPWRWVGASWRLGGFPFNAFSVFVSFVFFVATSFLVICVFAWREICGCCFPKVVSALGGISHKEHKEHKGMNMRRCPSSAEPWPIAAQPLRVRFRSAR